MRFTKFQPALIVLLLVAAAVATVVRQAGAADGSPVLYLPLVQKGAGGPTLEGCPLLPTNNIWNARIDQLPVDLNSNAYIESIGRDAHFHLDFGSGLWNGSPIGIPYNVVGAGQPGLPVAFEYEDEIDSLKGSDFEAVDVSSLMVDPNSGQVP